MNQSFNTTSENCSNLAFIVYGAVTPKIPAELNELLDHYYVVPAADSLIKNQEPERVERTLSS